MLSLRAAVASLDGRKIVRAEVRGKLESPVTLVDECFEELMGKGAGELLTD
jgi:porphobilinogen deaminase